MTQTNEERRRFHRIATDKRVVVEHKHRHYEGTVLDISLRGLLLRTDDEWRPALGDTMRAKVHLDEADCCIMLDGEVAHIEDRQVGVHCIGLDLDSAGRLRRLVELNLADPGLLERELQELVRTPAS